MRLTTDFWVSALLRRVFNAGGFAAVVGRGAAEAGAAFLLIRAKTGEAELYGPAPQMSYGEGRPDDRLFTLMTVGDAGIEARLERERRFDPDIWVVELEIGSAAVEEFIALAKD